MWLLNIKSLLSLCWIMMVIILILWKSWKGDERQFLGCWVGGLLKQPTADHLKNLAVTIGRQKLSQATPVVICTVLVSMQVLKKWSKHMCCNLTLVPCDFHCREASVGIRNLLGGLLVCGNRYHKLSISMTTRTFSSVQGAIWCHVPAQRSHGWFTTWSS